VDEADGARSHEERTFCSPMPDQALLAPDAAPGTLQVPSAPLVAAVCIAIHGCGVIGSWRLTGQSVSCYYGAPPAMHASRQRTLLCSTPSHVKGSPPEGRPPRSQPFTSARWHPCSTTSRPCMGHTFKGCESNDDARRRSGYRFCRWRSRTTSRASCTSRLLCRPRSWPRV